MRENSKEEQGFFRKREEDIRWLSHGFLCYAWGILFFALLLLCLGRPVKAYAADYKTAKAYSDCYSEKERTANGITFSYSTIDRKLYATKNGKKIRIYVVPKKCNTSIDSVLTDGDKIYFAIAQSDMSTSIFYRYTFNKRTLEKIAKVKNSAVVSFAGYYNGTLFYVNDSASGSFCSLNTSTKKSKVIIKGELLNGVGKLSFAQIGKYIWFSNKYTICCYNAETGKTKTMGKTPLNNYASPLVTGDSKYIYYVTGSRIEKGDDFYALVSVIRCKPDGTQKKTLLKNIKVQAGSGVEELTSKSMTYTDLNGKSKTVNF